MSDHYLIVLSHTCDDVPIALMDSYESALGRISELKWHVPDVIAKRLDLPSVGTPIYISLIRFVDGEPVSKLIIRDFEEDQ